MKHEPAYAHSMPGRPESEWETLAKHLDEVGSIAARFASAFDSADWGRLAGLWHDIGKYRVDFQRRIRGERLQAPHAGLGAALAFSVAPPIAFAIAGHHAGLANRAAQAETTQTPLQTTVANNAEILAEIRQRAPAEILSQGVPPLPGWLARRDGTPHLRLEMWTRFLFSVLVDADRLATARFYDPSARSNLVYASIPELRALVDTHLDAFKPNTPVNQMRREVLEQCRVAAPLPAGLFSLTVPTGGGKTLASMSFGLRHSECHGLRRVIVVVPYTSIIEQNAEVYRAVCGADNVIEHHSAIDEEARERVLSESETRRRLAVENWDAPIIVTTAVQFFETLFNNEPSRCRKLHNVAKSVIVVDEAQTLPTDFLVPLLDGMKQLAMNYGCSILFSTATQPALRARNALPQGLESVREIVGDPRSLAKALQRTSIHWPSGSEAIAYEDIAREMTMCSQVLAIVHSRRDARRLAELLPKNGRHHLSTRMCAAHRLETLHAIRAALANNEVCRVVSTQLIEAGVDISFPVIFRAMAGLDSVAQAAGRCNRNGELVDAAGRPILGTVVVFRAESEPPRGVLRRGLSVADAMLGRTGSIDLSDPAVIDEYFRRLYLGSQLDRHGVTAEREAFNFASVAQRVRFIDQPTRPLIVPWGDAPSRVAAFEDSLTWGPGGSRRTARALQPFVVQVFDHELTVLDRAGALAPLEGFGHLVTAPFASTAYNKEFGLTIGADVHPDAEAMIQ